MTGPFNVGDVVVCVDASPPAPHPIWAMHALKAMTYLKTGRAYRVRAAGICPLHGMPFILLAGTPDTLPAASGYNPHRFRHLPKADEQFTAQMRSLKPIRKQVSA